jgi:two-component system KDP operon response regulator KdpE
VSGEGKEGAATLVLVVEDEVAIRKFLRAALEGQGYAYAEAGTGAEGIAQASMRVPDVVLLDLGLPDLDGLEVVRRIRSWSGLPIIVLTARGRERDKVEALDAGADDYVTKPFSMPELLARMRVALRHRAQVASGEEPSVIEAGSVRIDLGRRRVAVNGDEVTLTPIEFRLLAVLARHAGRVLTHEFLLREVWGPAHTDERHYLRVYMAQLRHKLESDPGRPRILVTETGVGYRLADEA